MVLWYPSNHLSYLLTSSALGVAAICWSSANVRPRPVFQFKTGARTKTKQQRGVPNSPNLSLESWGNVKNPHRKVLTTAPACNWDQMNKYTSLTLVCRVEMSFKTEPAEAAASSSSSNDVQHERLHLPHQAEKFQLHRTLMIRRRCVCLSLQCSS